MLEDLPTGARVLDVGSASGTLARLCINRGFILRGIEPNRTWNEETKHLYAELFLGSLEEAPEDFIANHEAVVCGDVLEHLVNPEEQLKRLVKSQPAGCLFIISVPNVANVWVRLKLLFGQFDYSDRGILDRTHLHFYTKKTFIKLLNTVKLDRQELLVTPIPLDLVSDFFTNNVIGRGLFFILAESTKALPALLGYQWITKAYKL